ncbi:aluminum-activated malate transporter 12-like protein, partial [Trifolium pratense]
DPCIRLAAEVSKVLIELANSIKNRRHCSPEILSDYLHEALEELDAAIKYHPRLFLGSNEIQANKPAPAIAATTQAGTIRQKVLERSQTSKMAINSLHFSEASPFAAFASLLLESVAKLDSIINEVKELGKLACFKEYTPDDEFFVSHEKRVYVGNHLLSHGVE